MRTKVTRSDTLPGNTRLCTSHMGLLVGPVHDDFDGCTAGEGERVGAICLFTWDVHAPPGGTSQPPPSGPSRVLGLHRPPAPQYGNADAVGGSMGGSVGVQTS